MYIVNMYKGNVYTGKNLPQIYILQSSTVGILGDSKVTANL